ncbi:MAG: cupin domain-containing protein [Actinomycetota bacterium]
MGVTVLLGVAAFATITHASPATGVTPTLLARGTYDAYDLKTDPHSSIDFKAKTKEATDVVVQRHDFQPGGSTGWHQHPGPIFITVTQGTLTFYERDDPTCSPHVVTAGHGYVDTGMGHIGINETNAPAQDVAVAIAPVGAPFRTELTAPGPYCNF